MKKDDKEIKLSKKKADLLLDLRVGRNTYILYTILLILSITHGVLLGEISKLKIIYSIVVSVIIVNFIIKIIKCFKEISSLKRYDND